MRCSSHPKVFCHPPIQKAKIGASVEKVPAVTSAGQRATTDGRGWGQALTRELTTKLPGFRGPRCSSAEREGESFLISNLPR